MATFKPLPIGSPVDYSTVRGDAHEFIQGSDHFDVDVTVNPGLVINGSPVQMGPINAIYFMTAGTIHWQTFSGATETWTVTDGQSYEGIRIITVLGDTTTAGLTYRVRW